MLSDLFKSMQVDGAEREDMLRNLAGVLEDIAEQELAAEQAVIRAAKSSSRGR